MRTVTVKWRAGRVDNHWRIADDEDVAAPLPDWNNAWSFRTVDGGVVTITLADVSAIVVDAARPTVAPGEELVQVVVSREIAEEMRGEGWPPSTFHGTRIRLVGERGRETLQVAALGDFTDVCRRLIEAYDAQYPLVHVSLNVRACIDEIRGKLTPEVL